MNDDRRNERPAEGNARQDQDGSDRDDSPSDQAGPVPVRDLMRPAATTPEAQADPRWEGDERAFELDGVEWLARPAGAGAYGTGGHGAARLLAIHFFRADEPDQPVREALLPAGRFEGLWPEELTALCQGATPIDTDDQRRGSKS